MNKEPHVTTFVDEEEEQLYRAVEADNYVPGASQLTAERKAELMAAAHNTLNDERTKITIRVSKYNLAKLKARALREGIPYQTLINSILHKAVNE